MNQGIRVLLVALLLGACTAGPGQAVSSAPSALSPGAIPTAGVTPFPSQPTFDVEVYDVDGPSVDLLIGGHVVASVPCGGGTKLVPGADGVPSLPWSLDVRRQGGGVLKHFDVTGGGYQMLLVRSDTIALGQFPSDGPAPAPSACARWGS